MTSSFVTWVNSWFYRPGTLETPENDRVNCFAAAVVLIGEFVSAIPVRRVQRNLHDLLTYLLLGWNPITAWPKESEFTGEPLPEEDREKWKVTLESMKRHLNFQNPNRSPCIYPLLTYLTSSCAQHGSSAAQLYIGERLTMCFLALWLFKRSFELPRYDLGLIRAYLDLYYRSVNSASDEIEIEYARTNHHLRYCDWFNKQVDRWLRLNVEQSNFINNLAYTGWFISLVRAERMFRRAVRCSEWHDEVKGLLTDQVKQMEAALQSADLRVVEDQIREGSSLQRSARLFRLFKIKPPPVKILPVES